MSNASCDGYLSNVCAVIVKQGVGSARADILSRKLLANGGTLRETVDSSVTHILVGNKVRLSRVPHLLKIKQLPGDVLVLRADWLSACLMAGNKTEHAEFIVHPEPLPQSSTAKIDRTHSQTSISPDTATTKNELVSSQQITSTLPENVTPKESHDSTDKSHYLSKNSGGTLSSPKAGMFRVSDRRWRVRLEPNRAKGRWEDADSDSDYVYSGDEEEIKNETEKKLECAKEEVAMNSPVRKKGRWVCEIPSSEVRAKVNHNQHITDKLEELLIVYENSGEKWRALQTTKAIQSIKKHHKEITSYEEAREVPFVGERIADKIVEIIHCGGLRRLEAVDKEREAVLTTFKNIHGVGNVLAQQFYAQGYRTLDDLRSSGILNRQQMIGLRHYNDFNERMSREEVAEIEHRVCQLCTAIVPGMEVVTCGSYRRGKETCGDIDLLITHPDGRSHKGVFEQLLQRGKNEGFFTDDLSVHNDPGGQCKYLGVCRLGPHRKYRRIDIILVPYNEFPLALLHFTGSGRFNRSMRNKADKMGMSLSEHALCTGVIRKNGAKIFDGTPLPVTCERDVFDYLDMEYKEPTERDHA